MSQSTKQEKELPQDSTPPARFLFGLLTLALFLAGTIICAFVIIFESSFSPEKLFHNSAISKISSLAVVSICVILVSVYLLSVRRFRKLSEDIEQAIEKNKITENSSRENTQENHSLGEKIAHQIWTAEPNGKLNYVNEHTSNFFGGDFDLLMREGWKAFVHPDDLAEHRAKWNYSLETGDSYENQLRLQRNDGQYLWHIARATPEFDANGKITRWLGTTSDIDEQIKSLVALQESEHKSRNLLENLGEGLLQLSNDFEILFVNRRFCEMTGYSANELVGKKTFEVLVDEESLTFIKARNAKRLEGISEHYELNLKKKSGDLLCVLVGGAPTRDRSGEITGSIGVFTDITDRKLAEARLTHDAFHDTLTGLANRALFTDHLRLRIERAKREKAAMFAVLFLDFDRFKVINDSLGHSEGDKLLVAVAKRLQSILRSSDLIARLGGDEYTILLNEIEDAAYATQIAARIQELLNSPFELDSGEVFMSASIGIALNRDGSVSAEEMLRNADIAMYRAKAEGKARHQVFDQAMHEEAQNQLQIETDLRQALGRDEFRLHYQPIYSLETESLVGFEALVRWQHPLRGMIPPNEFISIAEENGLIIPLGRWIMYESCRQMREWQKLNPAAMNLTMSVNISCKQFLHSDITEQVTAMLVATRLEPKHLKLEITESHVMENGDAAVEMMKRLHSLGIELSLDDFGTGYSSLSYLHRLPVSNLKIDRSFVNRMVSGDEDSKLVSTIVALAHNLNINVTAEGIETADQLAQLKAFECEKGQGYYFSKPLESDVATELIKNLSSPITAVLPAPDRNLDLIG